MNAIALAAILVIRIILPASLLIAVGEWVRRREADYWVRK